MTESSWRQQHDYDAQHQPPHIWAQLRLLRATLVRTASFSPKSQRSHHFRAHFSVLSFSNLSVTTSIALRSGHDLLDLRDRIAPRSPQALHRRAADPPLRPPSAVALSSSAEPRRSHRRRRARDTVHGVAPGPWRLRAAAGGGRGRAECPGTDDADPRWLHLAGGRHSSGGFEGRSVIGTTHSHTCPDRRSEER